MKIVVTGAGGLLGWHAAVRLHAANCAARFRGEAEPHRIVPLTRDQFADAATLRAAVADADAVLHFAGVNRGPEAEVEQANPQIAQALVAACAAAGARPHIVYANSTHAASDTPYGRSKRIAGDILQAFGAGYTNLVLPHIFGECARPNYNNVTATFIDAVTQGLSPTVNPDGRVRLLHAGEAAAIAIGAARDGTGGDLAPSGLDIGVPDLLGRIQAFHAAYSANLFPDLRDPFDTALFNTYRASLYPHGFPRPLTQHADPRGTLFEAAKGGGGGQTFLSWTHPGITRGNHFHLHKVERFLVVEGDAIIRIRRALREPVMEYRVSGRTPAAVDMPTLHTHSIENVGTTPLLTLFWTNEVFDPSAPDTYADPVLRN
ncbi:MAG: SDR family oxidoreductase [Rhizobiales bacterium]|nr:SDR family oxidoreductase [Hyphomicrobiales bacterium]